MSVATKGPRVVSFIEQFCTLNKSFAGQPFIPLPWMRDVIDDIFLLNPDGTRKHSEYLLGIPRKNAKSTLAAAIAIYMLVVDDTDDAPEIVIAAGDREQARNIFNYCRGMVEARPELSERLKVYRNEIQHPGRGGRIVVVSADAKLKHGMNPSVVIIDEYHVHSNEDLYVALTSGFGARRQPLTLVISTAGDDLESPLGRMYERGRKVKSGELDDPRFGMTWYGPDPGEEIDPDDEEFWAIVNASWDIMNRDDMRDSRKRMPEPDFLRFHCNAWTAGRNSWFRMGQVEACHNPDARPLEAGDDIIFGFDGSMTGDCTAIVGTRIDDLHQQKLAAWERPEDSPEWRIPVREVIAELRRLAADLSPREIACDPWHWKAEIQDLEDGVYDDNGTEIHPALPMVHVNTQAKGFTADSKIFYDLVIDQELSHDGDLQYLRHLRNVQYTPDRWGNNRINKNYKASRQYIDIAMAGVISGSRARMWRAELEEALAVPEVFF